MLSQSRQNSSVAAICSLASSMFVGGRPPHDNATYADSPCSSVVRP